MTRSWKAGESKSARVKKPPKRILIVSPLGENAYGTVYIAAPSVRMAICVTVLAMSL